MIILLLSTLKRLKHNVVLFFKKMYLRFFIIHLNSLFQYHTQGTVMILYWIQRIEMLWIL